MAIVRIRSKDRQSNSGYHRSGSPNWWVMVESGKFADIPRIRGDDYLDVEVDVPDGITEVYVGVGKMGLRDAIRETIKISE